MPLNPAELKLYYNRCSGDALVPGDRRYVDIDAKEGRPRGHSWSERLAKQLELSNEPLRLLVTGLRGTGKSTELLRLKKRLEEFSGIGHLVVLVDADEVVDIANEIDLPDILMAIVNATERAVLELEGKDPDEALEDGYAKRLWTWLTRTDVSLDELKLTPDQQIGLVLEMKTRPTLRQRIRSTLAQHFSTFLREVRDELKLLEGRAQAAGRHRITVIFDSLEKLRGLSTNWPEVLHSAERVFGGGAQYLELPVHVVYTVPPALLNRRTDRIDFLPMVKLFHRDGQRHSAGFAAMRELVQLRLPDDALAELLGGVYKPRIDRLIERSGGHPRLLVQMLRALLVAPQLPVEEEDILRLFAEQRERYLAVITHQDIPWLQRIKRDKALTVDSADHLQSIDRALTNNVIFRYANADIWYDLHPALPDLAEIAADPQDD